MKFHHIAIEGPIGVGKTSLVKRLAQKFDAHVVMENVDNPFLKDFYEERTGAAFQAQLFSTATSSRSSSPSATCSVS